MDSVTPARTIAISVLGPLQVRIDGDERPVPGTTQRSLIVALAMAGPSGGRIDISALVDATYGDSRPPRPRRSLATLIWRLRQDWGAAAIESDRYHYWLSPDHCTVDAHKFEETLGRVRNLPGAEGIRPLQEALALWRTDDRESIAAPDPHRSRLDELRLAATEHLAELLADAGRHREAIETLSPIVAANPTWERSAAILIQTHCAAGDLTAAHQAFDSARRALLAEGVEPGPELRAAAEVAFPSSDGGSTASMPTVPDGIVGRATQRTALTRCIKQALETRRPTAILIRGEAGIGKTTLLRAVLIDVAAEGAVATVTITCDRRSTLPFGPLAAIAEAAAGGALAALMRPATQRPTSAAPHAPSHDLEDADQVHRALLEDVVSLATPNGLVLAIEDAQFAPRDTIRALDMLLQRCGPIPLAVVATTRDPDQGETDSGSGGFVGIADQVIQLDGLDVDGVAGMTHGDPTAEWTAQLHRLTGGNPLYVRQLQQIGAARAPDLADPATAMPPDLTAAIDAHLALVPPATVDALETAATVGDQFDLMTLTALTGPLRRSLIDWQEHVATALRHGLVRPDGPDGQYRFVHALIAAHLYSRLTPGARAQTHAAIALALERISLAHPTSADLKAHHYTHGWPELPTRDVIDALIDAARAVGAQLDFARAADYYRSALDYVAMDDAAVTPQEAADIVGAAAGARAAAGDLTAAAELYATQEKLAIESGLTRSRIFAALGSLRIAFMRRSHPSVAEPLAAALAESAHDEALTDYLDLVGDALAAVSVYRPARARELLDAFTSRGSAIGQALRITLWEHQTVPDQLVTARAALADARSGPHQVAAWLRLWVSEVAAGERRFDDAPPRDFSLGDADDQTVFDLAQWRITGEITAGRLARAQTLIKEALAGPKHPDPAERARRAASFYGQALFLSLVMGERGTMARSPIVTNPTWMSRHPVMRYVRVYLVAYGGNPLQARGMLDELIDELSDGDIAESDLGPRLILATETCRRLEHRRGLRVCLPALVAHQSEQGIFRFGQNWGSVRQSLGDAYLALGEVGAAVEAYRASIADLTRVASTVNLPTARRTLATALATIGRSADHDEVQALRDQADAEDRAMGLLQRIHRAHAPA